MCTVLCRENHVNTAVRVNTVYRVFHNNVITAVRVTTVYRVFHNNVITAVRCLVVSVRVSIQGVRCIQGVRVTTDYLVCGDPAPGHPRSPLLTSTCYLLLSP